MNTIFALFLRKICRHGDDSSFYLKAGGEEGEGRHRAHDVDSSGRESRGSFRTKGAKKKAISG